MASLLHSSVVVILLCSMVASAPTAQEELENMEDKSPLLEQIEDGILEEGTVRTKKSYPTATVCVEIHPTSPNSKPFTVCEPSSGQPIILPPSSGYHSAHQVVGPFPSIPSAYSTSSGYGVTHHNQAPIKPSHFSGGYRNYDEDALNDFEDSLVFANPSFETVGASRMNTNEARAADARTHHKHQYPNYGQPAYGPPVYSAPVYSHHVYSPPVYSAPVYAAPPPPPAPPVNYAPSSCPTNYMFSCQPNVTPVSCNGQPLYQPPQYASHGYGSYREANPQMGMDNHMNNMNNMNMNSQQQPGPNQQFPTNEGNPNVVGQRHSSFIPPLQHQQQHLSQHPQFSMDRNPIAEHFQNSKPLHFHPHQQSGLQHLSGMGRHNQNFVGNEQDPIMQPLHTMSTMRSSDDASMTKAPTPSITPTMMPSPTTQIVDQTSMYTEKTREEKQKADTIARMAAMAEEKMRSKLNQEKQDPQMSKPQNSNPSSMPNNPQERTLGYYNPQPNYADVRQNII